ncbi:oxygenase MpaB family protein [Arcicella rigui]|uniref:Oxygenase MpaB family protein n=1 Tax=Arcicella rigui TaxID=797020 RepID=A0ABU5QDD1_9BACT|nr:oxygenase MpaB family protein [Arcicella rigui]MEA5140623.1 oxygenase MpaB family protein [Arcicella rigui]
MNPIKPTRSFSNELMDRLRQTGDEVADNIILQVFQQTEMAGLRDFFKWLNTNETEYSLSFVNDFVNQKPVLPALANWKKMQKGMDFFKENQERIGIMLACLALPYCYAGADGAKVLAKSQRIQNDTLKRLEETGEFIFTVMQEKNWHNGKAFRKILKVRLMHAAIRFFSEFHGTWNTAWGKPVNQEDMAGTNGAFSYIVIRGLRKTGKTPSESEEEAYLHLWNIISHIMGVEEVLIPQNLREAFTLDKVIANRQFRPSEEGKLLTKSLLQTLESFVPNPLLKSFPAAQMRYLLGDEIADLLGIPFQSIESKIIPFIPTQILFKAQPS